jgi:hypothetical protein
MDDIRTNVIEIGWEFVDWIHMGLDTDQWRGRVFVNTVTNLWVP